MTDSMSIQETRDKDLLSEFFRTDPVRYAYQLGDLDPFFFQATRWWITQRDQITSSMLLYTAFDTAVLQALSDNDDQDQLWQTLLPNLPDRAHAHYLSRHESILRQRYRLQHFGPHQRMQWYRHLAPRPSNDKIEGQLRVLTPNDRSQIQALYQAAYPGAYFDERTLETGRTVGVFTDTTLSAIAACHVYSPHYSVAAIGAVATHPDVRGRGYCTAAMRALIDLLDADVDTIALNVHCDNQAAIRIYERLGFRRRLQYEEAMLDAI